MSISFKFNYITYKINKMIIFIYLPIKLFKINKRDYFDLCDYSNFNIYIVVTRFSIIQYIYYFIIGNEHKINNNM